MSDVRHDIDPKKKDAEWHLKVARNAWTSFNAGSYNSLYAWRSKYRELTDVALSRQSVDKYKKILKADQSSAPLYKNMNWQPFPILTKFLELGLAIVKKQEYAIEATPVDPISQGDIDNYFKEQETKILLREELDKQVPGLSEQTPLKRQENEPADMAELELQKMYTFKHDLATEVEQALGQVYLQNNLQEVRSEMHKCWLYYGVAGCKEYVDVDGLVKIRAIRPSSLVCSRVTKRNFSDAAFIGEVLELTIDELADLAGDTFDAAQLEDIRRKGQNAAGVYGAIPSYGIGHFSADKKLVLDLEFTSYDIIGFEENYDKFGNKRITRTDPKKANKRKEYKMIYKCKWVVGTDYIFDWGPASDMKRKMSRLQDTSFSYHLFAPNLNTYDMSMTSKVEQAQTVVDQINLAYYRLQQVVARARLKGIQIDIGVLEDVPLGSGGQVLTPTQLVELFNSEGTLIYRAKDLDGNVTSYQPIRELEGGMGAQATEYITYIREQIQYLRDIIGLNEVTDSFGGPRTSATNIESAQQSTNNSLYFLIEADREIMKSLSDAVIMRLQVLFRNGNVNPTYFTSLGKGTVDFFKKTNNISTIEFGLELIPKPNGEEKQIFLQRLEKYVDSGLLDLDDMIMLQYLDNMKMAYSIMAYKVRKKRENAEKIQAQQMQMNAQIQQQSAQVAEAEKRKTLELKLQVEMQIAQAKMEAELKIAELQLQSEFVRAKMQSDTQLNQEAVRNESKEYIAELMAEVRKERNPAQISSDLTK